MIRSTQDELVERLAAAEANVNAWIAHAARLRRRLNTTESKLLHLEAQANRPGTGRHRRG